MKKWLCIALCIALFALAGCGSEEKDPTDELIESIESANEPAAQETKIDVDLTAMSSTMVYSEVYNMVMEPSGYLGKTVRMNGLCSVYCDEFSGKYYFACIIADATACCSQGIEFVLEGVPETPDCYPADGEQIVVTGTFGTYQEGEYTYCQLTGAHLE